MAAIWHRRPTTRAQTMDHGTAIEHLGIEFVEVGDDWSCHETLVSAMQFVTRRRCFT